MVSFSLPFLNALALVASTSAAPSSPQSPAVEVFSFAKWVDGIIANPDGVHLNPEEAVEAWHASLNATSAAAAENRPLEKRYSCNTIPGTEAYVPDAVSCINELARRGSDVCRANPVTIFCLIGRAQITGVAALVNGAADASSSCNDVARGAGYVMDHCTRADNTVQGAEYAYGNGNLYVWIRKPS